MLIAVTASFFLSACGVNVTRTNLQMASYGPPLSDSEAIALTRKYFSRVLIDPDSLKLNCSQDIAKGWARNNQFDEPTYGYLVWCQVNAKNQFGGYTGNQDYVVVVNGSNVFAVNMKDKLRNKDTYVRYKSSGGM